MTNRSIHPCSGMPFSMRYPLILTASNLINTIDGSFKCPHRLDERNSLVSTQRRMYGIQNTLSPQRCRQTNATAQFWMKMANGVDVAFVCEDGRADSQYDGTNAKWGLALHIQNPLRSPFALNRKFVAVGNAQLWGVVEGDTIDCCVWPCHNLCISVHTNYVEIYQVCCNLNSS